MSTSSSIVEDPDTQNRGQFSNSNFHRRLDPEILLGPVIPLPKIINVKEVNIITVEQDNERDISNESVEIAFVAAYRLASDPWLFVQTKSWEVRNDILSICTYVYYTIN